MLIKKKKEVIKVVGAYCDICGQSCERPLNHEFATLSASWGYDSERDMTDSECHMCEKCFNRVVEFIESIGGKVRHIENNPGPQLGVDYVIEE